MHSSVETDDNVHTVKCYEESKLQCCTITFIFQQTQRHKHLSAGNQIAWALSLLHLNRMGALDQIASLLLLLLLVAFVSCISNRQRNRNSLHIYSGSNMNFVSCFVFAPVIMHTFMWQIN